MSDEPTGVVVVGAGGHGRELLEVAETLDAQRSGSDQPGTRWPTVPKYRLLGVLDDGEPDPGLLARCGVRHLGPVRLLAEWDVAYVLGIGSPVTRRAIDVAATGWGRRPATLVHPRAVVGRDVVLGPGTVVCALASVTTNVRTGRHVHLNVAATVAHDCRLGDYVTLAPGARLSGTVTVGDSVVVGTSATVIQGLTIGHGTTVGAGAVVIRDLPPGVVAVGVPAQSRPVTQAGG